MDCFDSEEFISSYCVRVLWKQLLNISRALLKHSFNVSRFLSDNTTVNHYKVKLGCVLVRLFHSAVTALSLYLWPHR